MLFSDNVSVEDELALKQLAHEKGLLMMGPDCGTAIINGAALCFGNAVRRGNIGIVGASELALKQLAHEKGLLMMGPDCGTAIINGAALCFGNAVRRGNIGIVGASGTGSQELSVRIHEFGGGVSQLIGTGGRDLSEKIGGLMMLDAIGMLENDPQTEIIVLISKPPAPAVARKVGTGGRDLSEKIGGLMMLDAIGMLENDPQTEIIVLISKPPAPAVARKVLERARACRKPVVACFLGRGETPVDEQGLQFARGSKEAALKAVMLSGVKQEHLDLHTLDQPLIADVRARLQPQQKYIRGLFCGGTLCDETLFAVMEKHGDVYSNIQPDPEFRLQARLQPQQKYIRGLFCGGTLCDETLFAVMEKHGDVYSNIQPDPEFRLQDINRSIKHTFLDFGDDDFTNGKPHPMIDPTNRISRLIEEARDPEVAVIVMDFVLGFGSHEDPVGSTIEAIKEAKAIAAAEGRELIILAYVLGTDLDTPSLEQQSQMLLDAGVILASSKPQQKYIRGLFCGGTLCDETLFAVMEKHGDVYSNIQPDPEFRLQDINRSIKHTFLDFGDDDFTNGKPHPMIDPTNRISRLIEEARDPEVAVIVMDFVLGFGSHEDPVGSTIEAIKEAKAIAAAEGRELIILAYVLGTDLDTPSLEQQSQMLLDAGVILASSSTNTGLLAREFICKGEEA